MINIFHEVVAFAGRLWWADLGWGVVSADPFSDRPELRFIELPRGSVLQVPTTGQELSAMMVAQGMYRRIGVSEGRLRYVEVSQEKPFVLSSFTLDDDCCCWMLEHQVMLGRLLENVDQWKEKIPWIAAIDPLNASVMCVIVGDHVLAVDMDSREVVGCSHLGDFEYQQRTICFGSFLPCVLPSWLGSSRIPSAAPALRRRGGRDRAATLSTAAPPSRTPMPWAMIYHAPVVRSTAPRATLLLAEPPCASDLLVPDHLFDRRPGPDPDDGDKVGLLGGMVCATMGEGLLLLGYLDSHVTAPVIDMERGLINADMDPDITRLVCNPISGELFRLPDIDGTKRTLRCRPNAGLLTRSAAGHGPPFEYAVALLNEDITIRGIGGLRSFFTMRRFLSRTGEWEKLAVGLSCRLPSPEEDGDAVAFDGRLWWVDPTWGAISADPFSDRPELRFVELPADSVWPVPPSTDLIIQPLGMYRRIGVSEGRLRYVELPEKYPFVLSSFALDDDGSSWTLEHRVALGPLCREINGGGRRPLKQDTLRIGAINPVISSVICVLVGKRAVAVDLEMGKVLGSSPIDESEGPPWAIATVLKPCLLPPWLASFQIPTAGFMKTIDRCFTGIRKLMNGSLVNSRFGKLGEERFGPRNLPSVLFRE
uniref:DUF1618 domain-containing protein n=1 Tax=Leersia perrieri TaxID=77586 RepID=A0A0D9WEB4_9ORYZ